MGLYYNVSKQNINKYSIMLCLLCFKNVSMKSNWVVLSTMGYKIVKCQLNTKINVNTLILDFAS